MTEQPPTPATPPDQSAITQRDDDSAGANVSRETQRDDDQRDDDQRDDDQRDDDDSGQDDDQLRQSFDRDYVERLRTKSAGYRLRAKDAEKELDATRRALFQERLQRLDLVVDPEAVPYDAELLEDSDALQDHVEALLESKPYLRKRKTSGNIGQHTTNDRSSAVSLLGMMKNNAG